ncbi:MAG TPA: hypothetical protein DEB06_04980, partial [Phycisphaerales bacterium]|nr:hypothetical protein [Phycisphaerales bacterium]
MSTPVLRFLPDTDLSTGPFGLLGLAPAPTDGPALEAAMRRQLARLARHPLGRSTEADEVRLALHVAAAQLSDPRVQEELLLDLVTLRAPPRAPAPRSAAPARPAAPTSPRIAHPAAAFEHAALAVLVHSGGWNRNAQRRLAALAHAHQADAETVRRAVIRIASQRRAPATVVTGPAVVQERPPPIPRRRPWRWVAPAVLAVTTLGSAGLCVALWQVLRGPGDPPARAPADAAAVHENDAGVATRSLSEAAIPHQQVAVEPEVRVADAPAMVGAAPERSDAVERWADAVRAELSSPASVDPWNALRSADRLARLNAQGSAMTAGLDAIDESHAMDLAGPGAIAGPDRALLAATTAPARAPDGRIAERFLLARRSPGEAIDTLRRMMAPTHALGPADCDALASAALSGASVELRTAARRFISAQTENPVMLHALLEALPGVGARDEASVLIGELTGRRVPRPSSPGWMAEARGALLARLSELLGAESRERIDRVAASLQKSWTRQAGEAAAPAPSATGSDADPAAR